MADQPSAELVLDEEDVRTLLAAQASATIPDAAARPLLLVAEGWDSAVWRLGDDLAVRLPRRGVADVLVRNEQRWLPRLASRIEPSGIRVPSPVFAGRPGAGYPWAWSIVPWIPGTDGLHVARHERAGWAEHLAAALAGLHAPAPAGFPVNPFRGVPLVARSASIADRFARLRTSGDGRGIAKLEEVWGDGLRASVWSGPPVWMHGDLHPGNLVAAGGALAGIIDFGDLTAGDPAYDLAVAWLAFDEAGRGAFVAATGDRYGAATWTRARAWAAAMTAILLDSSDDNPAYARLARETLAELVSP